jgi:hypothetical protein
MGDPNWFYSTLAQSSAAIVGLAGGFMVSRVLAQRSDIAGDRSRAREQMLLLHNDAIAQAKQAKRVEKSLRRALPIAENTSQLEIASIETFTHPGNHGQQGNYAADTNLLSLLRQIPDEARDYREALRKLAKNPKALTDNLRAGKEAKDLAADWLNEEMERTLSGGNVYDTLGQQRDWLRNDWQSRGQIYDNLKLDVANLRTRAAIGSLWGLVGVLAAFLFFGVFTPLAYLSARAGASRVTLLVLFALLALAFLLYLANEVRRLSNALRLEREFW